MNVRRTVVEVADNMREREFGRTKCNRIILTRRCCTPSKPFRFSNLTDGISDPSIPFAQIVTKRCHAVRRGKLGVEIECLIEATQRLARGLSGSLMNSG